MQDLDLSRSEIVFMEPLTVRIPTAGDLEVVKVGRSTLVLYTSLKALIGR